MPPTSKKKGDKPVVLHFDNNKARRGATGTVNLSRLEQGDNNRKRNRATLEMTSSGMDSSSLSRNQESKLSITRNGITKCKNMFFTFIILYMLSMIYVVNKFHSTHRIHHSNSVKFAKNLDVFSSSTSKEEKKLSDYIRETFLRNFTNYDTFTPNDLARLSLLLQNSAKIIEHGKFHQRLYVTLGKLHQYIGSLQNQQKLPFGAIYGSEFQKSVVKAEQYQRQQQNAPPKKFKPPFARGGPMSACLLLKDDNGQLIEWLAYHYHIFPLRYLVVAVDPHSSTSPLPILKRWNQTMGMDIQLWSEPMYFPKKIRDEDDKKMKENKTTLVWVHRDRQAFFIKKCMLYHKRHRRTWTLLTDSDEYIMFNRIASDDDAARFKPVVDVEDGFYEYKPKKWPKNGHPKNLAPVEYQMFIRTFLPVTMGEMTIAQHIHELKNEPPYKSRPCITLPRLLISGQEENSTKLYNKIPDGFDPTKFNTLRFFHHGEKGSYNVNKFGKAIVDVSRIKERSLFGRTIAWGHRPLRECGPPAVEKPPHGPSLLRINHYLGSLEAFLSRTDERRSVDKYLNNTRNKTLVSYDMQGWLESFVREIGIDKAKELLEGVGHISESIQKIPSADHTDDALHVNAESKEETLQHADHVEEHKENKEEKEAQASK